MVRELRKVAFLLTLVGMVLGGWQEIHYREGGPTLWDVDTDPGNPYSWIAVGDDGWVYRGSYDSVTDSMQVLGGECRLYGVDWVGSVIYVVGERISSDPNLNHKGVILKSTDGGSTWNPVTTPDFPIPTPFYDVAFVDEQNGWVSCAHGYVLRTTNGGNDWQVFQPGTLGDAFLGVWTSWLDQNMAWVCGDNSSIVAHTEDGGQNWIVEHYYNPAPVPDGNDSVSYLGMNRLGDLWPEKITGSYGTFIDKDGTPSIFESDDQWFYDYNEWYGSVGSSGLIFNISKVLKQ